MTLLYFEADGRNLLVAGAANKTERMTGLFCRFGVDDNADIMPICHLYRTQELRLAEYLGVPERIRAKTPDPGIIPGVTDKYVFFTGMSSEKLDHILAAYEGGMQPGEIAAETGIELEKVNYVGRLLRYSEKMCQVPAAPEELPQ